MLTGFLFLLLKSQQILVQIHACFLHRSILLHRANFHILFSVQPGILGFFPSSLNALFSYGSLFRLGHLHLTSLCSQVLLVCPIQFALSNLCLNILVLDLQLHVPVLLVDLLLLGGILLVDLLVPLNFALVLFLLHLSSQLHNLCPTYGVQHVIGIMRIQWGLLEVINRYVLQRITV